MTNIKYDTRWKQESPLTFKVKNICSNKRVRIFGYPIGPNKIRDLLEIPNVSESDIRFNLLKGALHYKLKQKEVVIVESNIDLLQFEENHKSFLKDNGVVEGLEISNSTTSTSSPLISFKQGVSLEVCQGSCNRIYRVPDKFIQGDYEGNTFRILIWHNSRNLVEGIDYIVAESAGAGTGFDTIIFTSLTPKSKSILLADYVVKC